MIPPPTSPNQKANKKNKTPNALFSTLSVFAQPPHPRCPPSTCDNKHLRPTPVYSRLHPLVCEYARVTNFGFGLFPYSQLNHTRRLSEVIHTIHCCRTSLTTNARPPQRGITTRGETESDTQESRENLSKASAGPQNTWISSHGTNARTVGTREYVRSRD